MGLDLLRRRSRAARLALAGLGLALLLAAPRPAPAAEENAVKAAFLYKFLSFVEWPEGRAGDGTVTVCVLRAPAVRHALETIRSRHDVGGRPLALRRIEEPAAATGCHALYVGAGAEDELPSLLRALRGRPVLTVSDLPGFARRGGMIGLLQRGGRLRFEVDRAPAREAGLALSARLLRLATDVRR